MKINLAENMLRFGAKNLTNASKQKLEQLAEQTKPVAKPEANPIVLPKFKPDVYAQAVAAAKQSKSYAAATNDYIAIFNPKQVSSDTLRDLGGAIEVYVYAFTGRATPAGGALPFLEKVGSQSLNIAKNQITVNDPAKAVDMGLNTVSELNLDWGGSAVEKNPLAAPFISTIVNGPRFKSIADSIDKYIANVSVRNPNIATEIQNQIAAFTKLGGAKAIAGKKLSELVGKVAK